MACPDPNALESLCRGGLAPQAGAALREHLRTCPACARVHERLALEITLRDSGSKSTAPGTPPPLPDRIGTLDTVLRPASGPGDEATEVSGEPAFEETHPRGSTLGRYIILDRLGSGGMGIVYAAFDPDLDRRIALKILRAEVLGSSAAQEFRLRLLREAQALARLSHPNVTTVHDVGIVGDQVFVAMEFVDGQTLGQWAAAEPRTWRQVLDVYLRAGEGLAAAHAAGLVHRDFKPDNAALGKDGRVRVMDFGLAHGAAQPAKDPLAQTDPLVPAQKGPMRRRITQPGMLLGTPAYMSPEQLLSRPTDPRSDQFSFCVSLYEGLFKERPFAGDTPGAILAEVTENRVRPEPKDNEVPARIRRLLLRGLRCDPAERFRSMDALLIGLGRRKSAVRRRWILLASAALAAVAAIAISAAVRVQVEGKCSAVAAKLEGVWEPKLKSEAKAAFLATGKPYASQAWAVAGQTLDEYAATWVLERTTACEAAHLRGIDAAASDEALGHRIVCLGRRLDDLQALGRLFSKADAEVVERAVAAAKALPALSRCKLPGSNPRQRVDEEAQAALRQKLADAKARLESGKYAAGLTVAREAVEDARRASDRASESEALCLVGVLSLRRGDAKAAESSLEEAILAAEASREEAVAARAWIELVGVVGGSQARYEEGRARARHASAALERLGSDGELEASLHNNLGVISWMQGRYDEALVEHQRAFELRERTFGPEHPIVAKSLSNIGVALRAQGRYAEALERYQRAQAIEERALTPEHPAVAETLNNLANVLNEQGEHEQALAYMRRALAIKESAYGPEQLTVAVTLNNIAAVLHTQKRFEEALAMQERALAIKLKLVSPNHPTLASSLTNLASIQRGLGRYPQSLQSDTKALAIREQAYGPGHSELAHNLVGIGQAKLGLKHPAEALAPLEKAVAVRHQGKVDPLLLAEARFALARALRLSKKDPARALALAREARQACAAAGDKAQGELAEIDAWLSSPRR